MIDESNGNCFESYEIPNWQREMYAIIAGE